LEWGGDVEISQRAAGRLLSLVQRQDQNVKVLEVRHCITEIPVVKVDYAWEIKGTVEEGHFFIYGRDAQVYFPCLMRENIKDACVCM